MVPTHPGPNLKRLIWRAEPDVQPKGPPHAPTPRKPLGLAHLRRVGGQHTRPCPRSTPEGSQERKYSGQGTGDTCLGWCCTGSPRPAPPAQGLCEARGPAPGHGWGSPAGRSLQSGGPPGPGWQSRGPLLQLQGRRMALSQPPDMGRSQAILLWVRQGSPRPRGLSRWKPPVPFQTGA